MMIYMTISCLISKRHSVKHLHKHEMWTWLPFHTVSLVPQKQTQVINVGKLYNIFFLTKLFIWML